MRESDLFVYHLLREFTPLAWEDIKEVKDEVTSNQPTIEEEIILTK